jgi:cyclopropane fatty-acyl-phospholipid synthase-like methyltransferase
MIYSCGYWADAPTLEEAQEAKLDLVFGKLGLRAGQRVLDVGCGWGSALKHAAERHGVSGTGVTISTERAEHAPASCAGLPVSILLEDYRRRSGAWDRACSIGMFEHVGRKNYRRFMETVHRCLRPDGRVPAAYDRVARRRHQSRRPVDRAIHLPELHHSDAARRHGRDRWSGRDRRLAAHRCALRPHVDGVAGPVRASLGGTPRAA